MFNRRTVDNCQNLPLTLSLFNEGNSYSIISQENPSHAMSILVVGSVAFDSVKTPFGEAKEILGGSASYFSISASFFSPVNLVAVVGNDFPQEHLDLFEKFAVDTRGLQRVAGKTFRWTGEYGFALNEAKTLDTQLNVFESFKPEIPVGYRNCQYVFLGNIDPVLQRQVLAQVSKPKFVACDTMNYWISSKPEELKKTLAQVDILIINDGEARMLTGQPNITKAAKTICSWGPRILVVKKGEYGVAMYTDGSIFGAPAFPLGGGVRSDRRRRYLCRWLCRLPGQERTVGR